MIGTTPTTEDLMLKGIRQYQAECRSVLRSAKKAPQPAQKYLLGLVNERRRLDVILAVVSERFVLQQSVVIGPLHERRPVMARSIVALLIREKTSLSLPQIARFIGGRHHTSILAAIRRTAARMERDLFFKAEVTALSAKVDELLCMTEAKAA